MSPFVQEILTRFFLGGYMKIHQLREYLDDFDEQAEVFVTLYSIEGSQEIYEITSASNNGGHLQLTIDEADSHSDIDFMDTDYMDE